ncbi:transposase [Paenibacillus thiaminolyticus]|uniref:transposase n=1 Tax=Paenibacillus thiaminolyticus TaxID=49283 RepID=UPI00254357A2|nr:transposase [Paenibacillus thiaminolyticus]WII36462.1 transposase [Paenibacillus thiaminolyticus]
MAAAPAPYVKNPKKDFTRKKKLSFETVMQLLISMGGNSLYKKSQPNTKGYNLLHLNAAYDLCNRLYVDAIVQPRRLCNEGRALAAMVDRSPIKGKTIVIADRGYESYNNFAHLERKGWNYVIRVKDLDSNGILSGLRLPSSGEFDRDIHLTLTKKQTKAVKAHPEMYKFVPSTSHMNIFFKRIIPPLCLLYTFFLACIQKRNGTGLFPMPFRIPFLFPLLSWS